MVSRKLSMKTLRKLHLSNRLYIEQVTCHLLILLFSVRACSETTKRNSICLEIPFDRSSSFIETFQMICVQNRSTGFFVMREVRRFCLISWWWVLRWARGFCRFLGDLSVNLQRMCVFDRNFFAGYWVGFCILHSILSKQIIVLSFFVVFELALSLWSLLKVYFN